MASRRRAWDVKGDLQRHLSSVGGFSARAALPRSQRAWQQAKRAQCAASLWPIYRVDRGRRASVRGIACSVRRAGSCEKDRSAAEARLERSDEACKTPRWVWVWSRCLLLDDGSPGSEAQGTLTSRWPAFHSLHLSTVSRSRRSDTVTARHSTDAPMNAKKLDAKNLRARNLGRQNLVGRGGFPSCGGAQDMLSVATLDAPPACPGRLVRARNPLLNLSINKRASAPPRKRTTTL